MSNSTKSIWTRNLAASRLFQFLTQDILLDIDIRYQIGVWKSVPSLFKKDLNYITI